MPCLIERPLRCTDPGCTNEIDIPVNESCAMGQTCTLTLTVQQTDYDNNDKTSELIEFIKVNGDLIKANVTPGKNPCKTDWQADKGSPAFPKKVDFDALTNVKVNVTNGVVKVAGKITQWVDECPFYTDGESLLGYSSNGNSNSRGYLFHSMASVKCNPVAPSTVPTSLLQTNQKIEKATAPHRRQLRGHAAA